MSLYSIIDRSEQEIARPVYKLRHCRESLARYSNHLTFLTKCRNIGLIPNGLKVNLPVRSPKADRIARLTSQVLLRERIGEAHKQIAATSRLSAQLESHLSQSVTPEQWMALDQHCKEAAKRVHSDTKERQIGKLTRLTSQQAHQRPTLDSSRLVVNRSSRVLTPVEEEVLALGMSFAIAPSRIPHEEIIAATEALSQRLDQQTKDTLRLKIGGALQSAKPPKPNLSPRQYRALMDLSKDEDIIIVPADKGKATVVLSKEEYIQKMRQITDDDSKYRILRRDPTVKTENRISDALKRLQQQGYIDEKLRDRLTPRYSNPPQLYGLPKIHKDGVPMRPIVSAVGSPCYRLAKELARILTPLTGHNGYTVKNSAAFVERVREQQTTPQDFMVSSDVKNLFTQVPIDEALRVTEEKLASDPSLTERTSIPAPQLVELVEL